MRFFSSKSQTFVLGQTNWADKFWGIWGIFGWIISTHFGTVSPLSMFFIIQPLFLQKTKPLYPNPKYLFGIVIRNWAAINQRFSLRLLVVRGSSQSRIYAFGSTNVKVDTNSRYLKVDDFYNKWRYIINNNSLSSNLN